jgi:hypothetical protein
MGALNTLVVLDADFVSSVGPGAALKADRHLIEDPNGRLSYSFGGSGNSYPVGRPGNESDHGWISIAKGAVYLYPKEDVKPAARSKITIENAPLHPGSYHFAQTVQQPVYLFVLILPPRMTLKSSNPKPTEAHDLGSRFVVAWENLPGNGSVTRRVDIRWKLRGQGPDRGKEVARLRGMLPKSERRQSNIFRLITGMKWGLVITFFLIALIAGWLALPSGLAISPPKIPSAARIPATVIFVIALGLSLIGLLGKSLPDLFHLGRSSR